MKNLILIEIIKANKDMGGGVSGRTIKVQNRDTGRFLYGEKGKSIKAGTMLFIVINNINRILLNKIFN